MKRMKWYDFFSNFYDSALEKLYFSSRQRAAVLLELREGDLVLDVACGTGANFTHILTQNPDVNIFATDFSEGMLQKAEAKIRANDWHNISLFQADARELTPESIEQKVKVSRKFDKIICVLGLSVMPDWELVLERMLTLLKENGQIVIVDVFAHKRDFNTLLVEKIAGADLDRPIWQTLQTKTQDFKMEYLPVKESKVGGKLFVAAGKKINLNH